MGKNAVGVVVFLLLLLLPLTKLGATGYPVGSSPAAWQIVLNLSDIGNPCMATVLAQTGIPAPVIAANNTVNWPIFYAYYSSPAAAMADITAKFPTQVYLDYQIPANPAQNQGADYFYGITGCDSVAQYGIGAGRGVIFSFDIEYDYTAAGQPPTGPTGTPCPVNVNVFPGVPGVANPDSYMVAAFTAPTTLSQYATTCGFTAFNWQQQITYDPGDIHYLPGATPATPSVPADLPNNVYPATCVSVTPANWVSSSCTLVAGPSIYQSSVVYPPYYDPPPGGYTYFRYPNYPAQYPFIYPYTFVTSGLTGGCTVLNDCTDFPPVITPDDKVFTFLDDPNHKSLSGAQPAMVQTGNYLAFATSLVGVSNTSSQGSQPCDPSNGGAPYCTPLFYWTWNSTFNGTAGGVEQTAAANPTDPGSGTGGVSTVTINGMPPPTATPSFSPAGGSYTSSQVVSISDSTSGAVIYYTTNGSTPTTSSATYSSAITVSTNQTLNAIALAPNYLQSSIATAIFKFVFASQTSLTVSPTSGTEGTVFVMQATVTANGAPVSSGSVTFYGGTISLGTAQINSATGIATLRTASLVPGANQIQAKYNQDNLDSASTSNEVAVTVSGTVPTSVALTSGGAQGSYLLTATVSAFGPGKPTGEVTFNDLSTQTMLGSAELTNLNTFFIGSGTVKEMADAEDIAMGDVDGDGHLDLVAVGYNASGNWVSVALGKGDGTFAAPQNLTTVSGDNNGGSSVTLADVNEDGKLDILATSWAGYGLAVFLGKGDGTFGAEAHYAVASSYSNSIAMADFNGDGKLDVVTTNPFGNSISVLIGNGDGTFQTQQSFTTDTTPEAVTVADFNSDGKPDMAIANTTGTVNVFLGNGDGTFKALPLVSVSSSGHYQGPKGIAAGDFNGDGNLDLAVSLWDSQSVGVLLGNGDGTFQSVRLISAPNSSPTGIAVADLNRDGNADIAVSSYNGSAATIMLGNGDGSFKVTAYPVDNGSASLSLADLNGDGLADLATVSSTNGTASILLAQNRFSAILTNVTLPGVGSDSVAATYSGDATFGAGTSNPLMLASNTQGSQTVAFSLPTTVQISTTLSLPANSSAGLTVTYTSSTTGVCSVSGNTVQFLVPGTCIIIASQSGNSQYSAAPQVTESTIVSTQAPGSGMRFIPVTPCRAVDTRNPSGPFGGPEMAAGSTRSFPVPTITCGIPVGATAYSLNITVVPDASLNYLTLWPTGQSQPFVSTLNSDGRVKANAAIVPAGTNGSISVFATDSTQVILDIDGYFVNSATSSSALAFYPFAPCRVIDTRNAPGTFGGPTLSGGSTRVFPLRSSSCNIPDGAQAYSLNFTAIPDTTLNYLTAWPTGSSQPLVSTLNSPTGTVVANAAIVPAGTTGQISTFVTDSTDLVVDIDGYFAPPGYGGLSLYTVSPCRVLDTRSSGGAFSGILAANIGGATCGVGATAQAYVLNATVVPSGPLIYLSLWPNGASQPLVSTLNAYDAAITSNMAVVPTSNSSVNAFTSNATQLILDISAYFAP